MLSCSDIAAPTPPNQAFKLLSTKQLAMAENLSARKVRKLLIMKEITQINVTFNTIKDKFMIKSISCQNK